MRFERLQGHHKAETTLIAPDCVGQVPKTRQEAIKSNEGDMKL